MLGLRQQFPDEATGVEQVLRVVHNEEEPSAPQVFAHIGVRVETERLRHDGRDERCVAQGCKRHPEDAVGESLHDLGRNLQRDPRLADSPRADDGYEPRFDELVGNLGDLALPPDQRRSDEWQIQRVETLERREVTVAELVDPLRPRQVLEAMFAKIAEPVGAAQVARRLRDEDLATVPGRRNARSAVHLHPDVALVREQRLAGVQTHADANAAASKRLLCLRRGRQRIGCLREGHEERVALRVHLDAAVTRERLPQHAPMLDQHVRVRIPELLQ